MSTASDHHVNLDEFGQGKCSVPMWQHGCPAGFCDKPAFGERPPSRVFWNYAANERQREDGRYNGYVPGLACPSHGGPSVRLCMDGNMWFASRPDFINLQESPAGFGETREAAIADLANNARVAKAPGSAA